MPTRDAEFDDRRAIRFAADLAVFALILGFILGLAVAAMRDGRP